MKHMLRLATAGALCAIILAPSRAAGQVSNEITEAVRRQQIAAPQELDQRLIIVNRRPPRPFREFERLNPETGAAIPPDSILTLPDGKQVRAAVYYAELNRIERNLTEIGYSLRDDWDVITLQESAINRPALEAQTRRIRTTTDASKPLRVRPMTELRRDLQVIDAESRRSLQVAPRESAAELTARVPATGGGMQRAPGGIGGGVAPGIERATQVTPRAPSPAVLNTVAEYPYSIGDPKLLAASVNARLDLVGGRDTLRLGGSAKAGVSVFGIAADAARLNASVTAPMTGAMSGKVTFDVLGLGTVYNVTLSGASVEKADTIGAGINLELASFRVMIGPVPVKVEAGARGDAGLRYYAGLNPRAAVVDFAPIVHAKLYVQAGVDVGVAGAGAGGEVNLISYDLSMYSWLAVGAQVPPGGSTPVLGVREYYQIAHQLEMLNGSAYAFAYIYLPRFGVPPWSKKEWRWEIFNWAGFSPVNGTLADVECWTSFSATYPGRVCK